MGGGLFLSLTSNPGLPHPHLPLTQHGAARVGALGFSVSAEEAMPGGSEVEEESAGGGRGGGGGGEGTC